MFKSGVSCIDLEVMDFLRRYSVTELILKIICRINYSSPFLYLTGSNRYLIKNSEKNVYSDKRPFIPSRGPGSFLRSEGFVTGNLGDLQICNIAKTVLSTFIDWTSDFCTFQNLVYVWSTVCQEVIYKVIYNIKEVTTSWTHSSIFSFIYL